MTQLAEQEPDARSSAGAAAKGAGKAAGKKAAKQVVKKTLGKKIAIALGIKGAIFLLVILLVVILAAVLGNDNANAGGNTSCGPVTPANLGGSSSSLTAEQNANARAIVGVALAVGAGERGAVIGVDVGFTEADLNNVDYGDMMGPGGTMSSSRGLFQQLSGWGPLADRMDPVKAATMFFTGGQGGQRGLLDIPGWQDMPIPQAAQAVQQSEFADGSNYAKNLELAQVITTAILASSDPAAVAGAGPTTPTGSAAPPAAPGCTTGLGNTVTPNGVNIALPSNEFVTPALRGYVLQAPTDKVAKGLGAGLGALGLPYVWGGGNDGGGPNDGCSRGGGELNSCQGLIGFDCSGLTAYVLVQGGYPSPGGNSSAQRDPAHGVPWDQGQVGDIVGFPGHVAIYLGVINGTRYILEASTPGVPVHVVPLTRDDYDGVLYRYWT